MSDESTNVGKISKSDIKALLQCSENELTSYIDEINRPKLESAESINYRESLLNCVRESRSIYKKLEKTVQLMQQKFIRQSQAIASSAEAKIKTETEIIQKVLSEKFAKRTEAFELEALKAKEAVEKQALLETQRAKLSIENCNLLLEQREKLINRILLRNSILYNLYSSIKQPIALDSSIISKYINSDPSLARLDSDVGFSQLLERRRQHSGIFTNFDILLKQLQSDSKSNQIKPNQVDKIKSSLKSNDYKTALLEIGELPKETRQQLSNSEFAESFKYFCLLDITSRYFTAHLTTLSNIVEEQDNKII